MPALGRGGQRRDGDANGRHCGEQEGNRGGWGGKMGAYMQKTCDDAVMAILAKKNCGKSA